MRETELVWESGGNGDDGYPGVLKTVIRQAGTSSMHIARPHVHRIRGAHDSVGTSRRVPLCAAARRRGDDNDRMRDVGCSVSGGGSESVQWPIFSFCRSYVQFISAPSGSATKRSGVSFFRFHSLHDSLTRHRRG